MKALFLSLPSLSSLSVLRVLCGESLAPWLLRAGSEGATLGHTTE